MAATLATRVEESGKLITQTVERQERNQTQAEATSSATSRTYFVDLFKEVKPEDVESINAGPNNWRALVLHFGHKMAHLMDWTRGSSANTFKEVGSGYKVKRKNLPKQG
eukprot:g15362.t1